MSILVLAAHDRQGLLPETAKTVAAAQKLGGDIDVLIAGHDCQAAADSAARLSGIRKILVAQHAMLEAQRAEPMQALILPLMETRQAFLAPATTMGRNIAPRIAAMLDVMQVSDIMAIHEDGRLERPIYAGNAIQTIRVLGPILVGTIRVTAFQPVAEGEAVPIEPIPVPDDPGLSEYVGRHESSGDRPDLASARRIVAGGRALGSEQGFETYIEPLADVLGAAIGASRAAVDAGYATNDCQIGQTGRIVAPELYIAIGISGAIQHVSGIKDAGIIVAINADTEAPIFDIADYSLIGDLFALVPELTKALAD